MEIKKTSWFYLVFCAFLSVIVVFMIFCIIFDKASTSQSDNKDIFLQENWTYENGLPVNISQIENDCRVYSKINITPENGVLLFKSEFASVNVYVNKKLVYTTPYESSNLFKDILPSVINVADLSNAGVGDTIELEIYPNYTDGSAKLSEIMIGTTTGVYGYIYGNNILNLFISVILLFSGIVLFILHAAFHNMLSKSHSLLFIAWFSVIFGICTILSNDLAKTAFRNYGITWTLLCMLQMIILVPIFLYVEDGIKFGKKKLIIQTCSVLSFASLTLFTVFNFTGVAGFQKTFYISVCIAVLTFLLLIAVMFGNFKEQKKSGKSNKLMLSAILIFGVCLFIDLITNFAPRLVFSSFGAIAVVFIGAYISFNEIVGMLELATRAEMIGKLAYTDGLTGTGNTTAFREKLDRLELIKENYDSIGIVQFDINNLKTVNDTMGHNVGDDMIINGAKLITDTFGKVGNVYRIGGDEFAVIVAAEHAPKLCDDAASKFDELVDKFNFTQKKKYKLQIAYGIAFYENDITGKGIFLKEIQKTADVRMYTKKKQMKENNGEKVRSTCPDRTLNF